jgi:hypothetical protein
LKKEVILLGLAIALILLGETAFYLIQVNPLQENPTSHKVFTWISHSINQSTAGWLTDLDFTDVVIRYVSDAELESSRETVESAGLQLWTIVDPWTPLVTISDYTIFDDIHWRFKTLTMQEKQEFLDTVRDVDHVSLTVYGPESLSTIEGLNLSGIDVDVYCLPKDLNLTVLNAIKTQARSLGVYLWIWKGQGVTWDNVTQAEVERAYSLAEQCGAIRFFVWMGSETDAVETGMSESSLINYPSWFPTIKQLNEEFRK